MIYLRNLLYFLAGKDYFKVIDGLRQCGRKVPAFLIEIWFNSYVNPE